VLSDGSTANTATDDVTCVDSAFTTSSDVTHLADGTITASVTQANAHTTSDPATITATKTTALPMPTINAPEWIGGAGTPNPATAAAVSGRCTTGDTIAITATSLLSLATPTGTTTCADGTWDTTVDVSALAEGQVTFTATEAGPSSTSDPVTTTSTKDTVAPTADEGGIEIQPEFLTIAEGTNFWTVTVTCTPGYTTFLSFGYRIDAFEYVGPFQSAGVCPAAGHSEQAAAETGFPDGTVITQSLRQVDQAGNVGPESSDSVTKDLSAPTAEEGSVVITPAAINAANVDAVPYSGTCVDGNTVVLVVTDTYGHTVAMTPFTCGDSGTYSGTFDASTLNDGDVITVSATQTDPAGNVGATNTDWATKDTIAATPSVTVSPNPITTTAQAAASDGVGHL